MKEILLNAGVTPGEIRTEEPIRLCPFLDIIKPKTVNNINGQEPSYDTNGYRKVRVLFDTGAGESVAPSDEFVEFPTQESEGSRRGWAYECANGKEVENEGQKVVNAVTEEFQSRACIFQVAAVTKPLMSAAQVTRAGFLAILDGPGGNSYLLHKKTKARTALKLENGVYCLDLWIKNPDKGF